MAVRTPEAPPSAPPTENGQSAPPTETNQSPAPLPEGYFRLSDVRKSTGKSDPYAVLKGFVGKTIQLDAVGFQTENVEKDGASVVQIKSGTMTFSEFGVGGAPMVSSPIPQAAVRTIYAYVMANPDMKLVCDVVQLKRGLSLQ